MLPKIRRLTKNGSFGYVYKNGSCAYGKNMTLLYVNNTNASVRVGFSVNNKIGKAVVRNKVKRRMRAYTATVVDKLSGCQCVFVAKVGIDKISYRSLSNEMEHLFKKANLLSEENNEEEKKTD